MHYPDVRVYDSSGARKAFPVDAIEKVTWEHLALGGFGQCTVTLVSEYASELPLAAGDRLEVWVNGALRYRGYVSLTDTTIDVTDRKTITVAGLAARMEKIVTEKRYLYPDGQRPDLVGYDMAVDWLLPYFPAMWGRLLPCAGTLYQIDCAGTAREAFDRLVELAGDQCVWGWEVSSESGHVGADQLYIIPRVTAPAKYKFTVGGNVKLFSYPQDHTAIVNTVHVFGAETRWPNLVKNPSFEDVDYAKENCGNLITNPSFEDWTSSTSPKKWNYQSSSLFKTDQHRTGRYSVGLAAANDYVQQTGIYVTGGATYTLVFYVWAPNAYGLSVRFAGNQSGNTDVVPSLPNPAEAWQRVTCQWTAGPSDSYVSITIKATQNSTNLHIDDVSFFGPDPWGNTSRGCPGWEIDNKEGSPYRVVWGDPAVQGYGRRGLCAKIITTNTAGEITLIQTWENGFDTVRDLKVKCRVRCDAGSSLKAQIVGYYYVNGQAVIAGMNAAPLVDLVPGEWVEVTSGQSPAIDDYVSGTPDWVRVGVRIINTSSPVATNVYVDEFYCFTDPAHEWDAAPYFPDYCRASNHEWWLSTNDSFIQNDSNIPAVVKASIATYGAREAEETVDYLQSRDDAEAWAKLYFTEHGTPKVAARLEVAECDSDLRCDGPVQLLGTNFGLLYPLRVTHVLRPGSETTQATVELGRLRPSFEGLLIDILHQAAKRAALESLR